MGRMLALPAPGDRKLRLVQGGLEVRRALLDVRPGIGGGLIVDGGSNVREHMIEEEGGLKLTDLGVEFGSGVGLQRGDGLLARGFVQLECSVFVH